jgi:hypothetical protein
MGFRSVEVSLEQKETPMYIHVWNGIRALNSSVRAIKLVSQIVCSVVS